MKEAIGCEAKRKEKHIELHEAIQGIDSLCQKLDHLLERIEGQNLKDGRCDGIDGVEPPFIEVLTCGAGDIREKTENVHQRIAKLTELLF